MLGLYVLAELLFEPELVATETKISHGPMSSTPNVHSPVLTVNREPKVILVEVSQGVFRILKLYTSMKGAQQTSVVYSPSDMWHTFHQQHIFLCPSAEPSLIG